MAVGETGVQLKFISPAALFALVRNTAPFLGPKMSAHPLPLGARLIELGDHPFGFLQILQGAESLARLHSQHVNHEAYLEDYFAFCLACHHATVATFVPTDVDSKIRGRLWQLSRDRDTLRRMFHFTLRATKWSLEGISARAIYLAGLGPVSGHNGELLSVLAGALGAFVHLQDNTHAELAGEAIHQELTRQVAAFDLVLATKGCELDALRIAASLTHNAGDLDQGIRFWPKSERHRLWRSRFARLAHEDGTRYGGAFQRAARIYRKALAVEGHRHYPLRAVKALRRSPDFLLPLGPFFDDWGATMATHPLLSQEERAEVLAALIEGCRTISGQRGYYRALAGMSGTLGGAMERVVRLLPAKARSEWKAAHIRKQIAIPRASFESMMKKMLAAVR